MLEIADVLDTLRRDVDAWPSALPSLRALASTLTLEPPHVHALERLFALAAWHLPSRSTLREFTGAPPTDAPSALAIDVADGQLRVLREADSGEWYVCTTTTLTALQEAAGTALSSVAALHAPVAEVSAKVLAAISLEGDVEVQGLDLIRYVRIVDEVRDAATEHTLQEVSGLVPDPDFAVGDEVGIVLRPESLVGLILLVLALQHARPRALAVPPDACATAGVFPAAARTEAIRLRFESLKEGDQVRVLIAIGDALSDAPFWPRALDDARRILERGGDPRELLPHAENLVIGPGDTTAAVLLLYLGDLAARRLGRPPISPHLVQDPLSIDELLTRLAALDEAELDRLLRPSR